jgi:hypothetical protein
LGRIPILVLAAIPLACCAGAEKQARFSDQFNRYEGLPISELTLRIGPPTRAFPTEDGRMAFMWDYLEQGRDCLVVVFASTAAPNPTLVDWRIRSWQYAGKGCM